MAGRFDGLLLGFESDKVDKLRQYKADSWTCAPIEWLSGESVVDMKNT